MLCLLQEARNNGVGADRAMAGLLAYCSDYRFTANVVGVRPHDRSCQPLTFRAGCSFIFLHTLGCVMLAGTGKPP